MDLFKDVVNAILFNKPDVFKDPEAEHVYTPFLVNRSLSYHQDSLFYANQMNQMGQLDKHLQINYYLNTIRARRRSFCKWSKPPVESDLNAVMKYYGYNRAKALQAMRILTQEQITLIKEEVNIGE